MLEYNCLFFKILVSTHFAKNKNRKALKTMAMEAASSYLCSYLHAELFPCKKIF